MNANFIIKVYDILITSITLELGLLSNLILQFSATETPQSCTEHFILIEEM